MEKTRWLIKRLGMKKQELKKLLKPIVVECIKEAILEEGILSGIITEVAKGITNTNTIVETKSVPNKKIIDNSKNQAVLEARKQLEETKKSLQESIGLGNVFEGTAPMHQARTDSHSNQYGALRDRDPRDPGVDISGLLKMTGGWKV